MWDARSLGTFLARTPALAIGGRLPETRAPALPRLRDDVETVNSPLGKYGQLVAAIIATLIILSWIVAELAHGMDIMARQPAGLKEAALIALGAVFGAAATVNGVKSDIAGAHSRLDRMGAPSASTAYDDVHSDRGGDHG